MTNLYENNVCYINKPLQGYFYEYIENHLHNDVSVNLDAVHEVVYLRKF